MRREITDGELLRQFEFQRFFLENLLWDKPHALERQVILKNESYRVIPIAQRAGFTVFVVESENNGRIPHKVYRKRLARKVRKTNHEHLLIFIRPPAYSIWHWMERNEHYETKLDVRHLTNEQLRLFDQLKFDNPKISIIEVSETVSRTLKFLCIPSPKHGGDKMATIDEAFATLIEAIRSTDQAVRGSIDGTMSNQQIREILDVSDSLELFMEKANRLKNEWDSLKERHPLLAGVQVERDPSDGNRHPAKRAHRQQDVARLPNGLKTHKSEYRVPILRALVELGGGGTAAEVLDHVYEQMKERLNKYDMSKLRSGEIRWRNTAMFVRNRLKNEGYLRKGSPRGTWEITDEGREYLRRLES